MKAILLVRVSTTVQELKDQEREVYELALKDGYSDNDIIPICEKESGIKLKEEERLGLNRLKEVVETEDVKDVYIWEVSRLARTKKVLFSMEEYFVSRRIQVTFKAPNFFRLLKDDGTLDEGADMIFTIYAQMAESEMRTKKERFKRSKDAKRKQGYYTGGFLRYGYTTDSDNKIIPHPEESEIVKMIFSMYLSGKYSYRSIAKELQERGIFKDKSVNAVYTNIRNMVLNYTYAGVPSSKGMSTSKNATDGNIYPALVTKEMVDKCREIAQNNINKPKKVYKGYYFGRMILRCPECGKIMMACKALNSYKCNNCGCTSVNINMVDSALWNYAAPIYSDKMANLDATKKEQYTAQISLLRHKIEVANTDIIQIKERAEKVEFKAYVEGTMNIAKAEKFVAELNKKIEAKNKEIIKYNSEITSLENLLLEVTGDYYGEYIDIADIADDKVKYDIIHEVIKMATINRIDKAMVVITMVDYLDNETKYLLDTRNHKIFTKFTPELKGLAECTYIERFTNTSKEAQRAYKKKYNELKKNDPEFKRKNAERQRRFRNKQS